MLILEIIEEEETLQTILVCYKWIFTPKFIFNPLLRKINKNGKKDKILSSFRTTFNATAEVKYHKTVKRNCRKNSGFFL